MKDIRAFAFLFLDQLRRQRWTAMLVTWVICIGGWFVVALMPDRYVSEARFHVDTTSLLTPLLKGISANSDDQSRDRQVLIMQRTLTSRPNLLKVTQMTDLDKTTRSEAALQDLLSSLESRISIKSQGVNLFLVQFTDNSPLMARNVVQSLLTIFVESSVGDKREDIKSARTFIDGQIEEYEMQLKAAEQRVADFKVKNVQYLSSTSQTFAMRMESAQDALKSSTFEYDDAVAQSARLRQQLSTTPQYLSVNSAPQVFVGGIGGGSLQQRILALNARLDDLRLQLTEEHPDVVNTLRSLNRLLGEQRLDANGQNGASAIDGASRSQIPNDFHNQLSLRLAEADGRVATARRKLTDAQSIFDSLRTRANEAPKVEAEFTNLTRDYEVFRSSYDALLQRRESARIAAAADSTAEPIQFRLVAAPELPARPSGPPRGLLNTMTLIAGILAGGAFVILMAKVNERVNDVSDLATERVSHFLGAVSDTAAAVRIIPRDLFFNRFVYAGAGLVAVFAIVLVGHPNLSLLLEAVM